MIAEVHGSSRAVWDIYDALRLTMFWVIWENVHIWHCMSVHS